VNDTTGEANSVAVAKQVSQDMEDILEHGGFRFKETDMSGDPLEEEGELRKVLGLRWDTERILILYVRHLEIHVKPFSVS
jgi:hypothetical protein